MVLSESLVRALEGRGISGVTVFCDAENRQEIAEFFLAEFTAGWNAEIEPITHKTGAGEPIPVSVCDCEHGFFIAIGALELWLTNGDFSKVAVGSDSLEQALKNLKKRYSAVEYQGYLGDTAKETPSGQARQLELSSQGKTQETYDQIGQVLGKILTEERYIPEYADDAERKRFVIAGKLERFADWDELAEQIWELGGIVCEEVSAQTDYLIHNDPDLTLPENKAAHELGVPILSEREWISKFGLPEEDDIEQSGFWTELSEQLEENDDFEETLEKLYAYRRWVQADAFERAVRTVRDIAEETWHRSKKELQDFVKKLETAD